MLLPYRCCDIAQYSFRRCRELRKSTYHKPSEKTPISVAFCFLERPSRRITDIGRIMTARFAARFSVAPAMRKARQSMHWPVSAISARASTWKYPSIDLHCMLKTRMADRHKAAWSIMITHARTLRSFIGKIRKYKSKSDARMVPTVIEMRTSKVNSSCDKKC